MQDQVSRVYIHYGNKEFNKNAFKPIVNEQRWVKPKGGFWASPICAEFGWRDWCEQEEFRECSDDCCFRFTLPEANILYISHKDDLNNLPLTTADAWWTCLDFEKLMECGYDAVELSISSDRRLYDLLYGWDCDSILVMNPDVIKPVNLVRR